MQVMFTESGTSLISIDPKKERDRDLVRILRRVRNDWRKDKKPVPDINFKSLLADEEVVWIVLGLAYFELTVSFFETVCSTASESSPFNDQMRKHVERMKEWHRNFISQHAEHRTLQ